MLENAIVGWLESLTEREFDHPLAALLRSQGLTDLHFVHGRGEFGRDFIAKRIDDGELRQYSLQSKAGDIGVEEFRKARLQIDSIRTGGLSHPGFDPSLPRVAVLVTTGRLVGDARLEAQAYKEQYKSELDFDVWDLDRLVELLVTRPEAALGNRQTGPLLRVLGMADAEELTDVEIERFSRGWIHDDDQLTHPGDALEAAVLMGKLHEVDRLDLACYTALDLLRGAAASASISGQMDDESLATLDIATGLFATYAEELFERCTDQLLRPIPFVNIHNEFGFFATYSVRCSRTIELLGLFALLLQWSPEHEDKEKADRVTSWLHSFVAAQPGAAHPLSDHYAVSLVPPALVLGPIDRALTATWLRSTLIWTANRYDGELLGLAPVRSEPKEEIGYVLSALEHVDLPPRRQSYIATILLDLLAALGLEDLYPVARHDLLAVDALPELLYVPDTSAQFIYVGDGIEQEISPPYAEHWPNEAGESVAPHHADTAPHWLERIGRPWTAFACSSVVRDRHDFGLIQRLLSGDPSAASSHQK